MMVHDLTDSSVSVTEMHSDNSPRQDSPFSLVRARTECRKAAERRGWRVCGATSLRSRRRPDLLASGPRGGFRSRAHSILRLAAGSQTTLAPATPTDGAAAMGFALALAARFDFETG